MEEDIRREGTAEGSSKEVPTSILPVWSSHFPPEILGLQHMPLLWVLLSQLSPGCHLNPILTPAASILKAWSHPAHCWSQGLIILYNASHAPPSGCSGPVFKFPYSERCELYHLSTADHDLEQSKWKVLRLALCLLGRWHPY